MQAIRFGIVLAKNVFQVHGVDTAGKTVVQKQLRRGQVVKFFAAQPPALIGIEACGSAHHWGRELGALGHDVRLMPPTYVKAYLKRNKNDARDAEACCEAVSRPTMRFVPVKLIGTRSAKPLAPGGHHRPHRKAEYMTAPDRAPETADCLLLKGGRPYMTKVPWGPIGSRKWTVHT